MARHYPPGAEDTDNQVRNVSVGAEVLDTHLHQPLALAGEAEGVNATATIDSNGAVNGVAVTAGEQVTHPHLRENFQGWRKEQ